MVLDSVVSSTRQYLCIRKEEEEGMEGGYINFRRKG